MTKKDQKEREKLLRKIEEEVLHLKSSPLYAERVKSGGLPVPGEGSNIARIMFVGEAPGRNEAKTGRPFIGAAGKILDGLLASVEVKREDVFITSIVKDRPPKNRDPLPEEIESYAPFLDRQIEIIRPKAVVALGRYAMVYLMQKFGLEAQLEPISQAHGKRYEAKATYGTVTIIPLYHPAAAIYNQKLKNTLQVDFDIIKKYVER